MDDVADYEFMSSHSNFTCSGRLTFTASILSRMLFTPALMSMDSDIVTNLLIIYFRRKFIFVYFMQKSVSVNIHQLTMN